MQAYNKLVVFIIVASQSFINFSQTKSEEGLSYVYDLKKVELKSHVLLVYEDKAGYSISFYVPKNKISEIAKFSKNTNLFLSNIYTMDSIYYIQYWYFHYTSSREYVDEEDLKFNSELEKFNYEIYNLNYKEQRKRGGRLDDISSEKINKRITIYEFECIQYYSGFINVNYVTYYQNNITISFLNLKLKNVLIPFVFHNYSECQ